MRTRRKTAGKAMAEYIIVVTLLMTCGAAMYFSTLVTGATELGEWICFECDKDRANFPRAEDTSREDEEEGQASDGEEGSGDSEDEGNPTGDDESGTSSNNELTKEEAAALAGFASFFMESFQKYSFFNWGWWA